MVDLILNAILIPQFASSGAAIGTLVAELVVLIVQFTTLRGEVSDAFQKIPYWKIILGLILGTVCSRWFVPFGYGNFLTLVVTACLFFGVYGLALLLTKEKLTCEIFEQIIGKVCK